MQAKFMKMLMLYGVVVAAVVGLSQPVQAGPASAARYECAGLYGLDRADCVEDVYDDYEDFYDEADDIADAREDYIEERCDHLFGVAEDRCEARLRRRI